MIVPLHMCIHLCSLVKHLPKLLVEIVFQRQLGDLLQLILDCAATFWQYIQLSCSLMKQAVILIRERCTFHDCFPSLEIYVFTAVFIPPWF